MNKATGPLRSRLLTFLLIGSVLVAIPALPAVAAVGDKIEAVDPANDEIDLPPPVSPPTEEQRQPVLDLSDIQGLWPEDIVEIAPGQTDPSTPDGALADAKLLPSEGSAETDVYEDALSQGTHIAVVHPDEVNKENAQGEWRDIKLEIKREDKGWSWTDPSGAKTSFPEVLSSTAPVMIETSAGAISMAPSVGESKGSADGATVRYANVFDGADVVYLASLGGVQEQIILSKAPLESTFSFQLASKDLKLTPNLYGGIDAIGPDGAIVTTMPAPVAYDSSPETVASTGTYELKDLGNGEYGLTISFDPEYLKAATYPVVIDPTWDHAPNRDGYTNGGSASTSYESNDFLQVDSNKRSYIKFDTTNIDDFKTLVYNSTLFAYPQGSGSVTGGVTAKRVSADWPAAGTLNWNNQPAVGSDIDNVTSAGADSWFDWDVTDLYQHYLDLSSAYNPHWDNYGVALTANNPKTFYAVDAALANSDPRLYVTYNNLPANPSFKSPPNGYVSESESLTLSIDKGSGNYPTDPDGDDVLVGFEISDDGTNWTGTHLIFASPFDDKASFTVPSGVLLDGQTYWWRAVSRDVCDNQTQALCSLNDGLGTKHDPNASTPKSFTVALKHFGSDSKYYMWHHDVGNDMSLQVNGSNGNAYLDLPLDTFETPIGELGIDLAYNSMRTADYGLTPGWELSIGPRAAKNGLPIEIVKMDTGADADLKIRFRGGRTAYFPHQDGKLWGATSSSSGRVWQDSDNKFHYIDGEGGVYIFDLGAANGAPILKAKPAQTAASSSAKSFDYTYDAQLHLTKVTDPLGRAIDITWAAGLAESITTVDFRPGTTTGTITYDLQYAGGVLDKITTPASETIDFNYASGLLSEVRDGVITAAGGAADGWHIAYAVVNGLNRVYKITAPAGGSPTSTPTPWTFRYHSPYTGTSVGGVCITDPRQTASAACDANSTGDDPFETQVEFNTSGYPVQRYSPVDPGATFRPVTSYVFDNHTNLLCERNPEANALGGYSCTSTMVGGAYTDLDLQGMSTIFGYQSKAPYRLMTKTGPAPDTSGGPRLRETYTYDGGATFNGLDVEMYGSEKLTGLPDDEKIWNDLDQDWDNGKPTGVSGDANTWSLRLSGLVDTTGMSGKKVKFRVYSDDGVRLSVEGGTILDCFADNNPDETVANCGKGDISKVVWGNDADITIEYADQTNDAALDVKWDQGNGTWQTIPAWALTPDTGIVTDTTYARIQAGGAVTDLWKESWGYDTDDLKFRHLHSDHSKTDLATSTSYAEEYTYDTTYGRVLTETLAAGTGKAATTTFTYTDGAAPSGWPTNLVGKTVSCLTKTVDELGFRTDYQCDRSGNQIKSVQNVRLVAGTDQVAQTRTVTTSYDNLGRAKDVTQVETGAVTSTTYDLAGRVATSTVKINGTTDALTTNVYDHAGHLMSETLPDPDGGGAALSPVISHQWNWADLETKRIDARGKQWTTAYDAMNRVVSSTSPLGAETETTYQLGSSVNSVVTTAPADVDTVANLDALGRTISEQVESFHATSYEYNVFGLQTLVTDPAGIQTKSTYSNLSELLTSQRFFNSATEVATTTNTYDVAGHVKQVDGPLSNDTLEYLYDKLGRLTSASYLSVYLPGSTTPISAATTYNDVGEQIQVSQPLTTSTTMNRYYSYDAAGRQATYRDAGGTTMTAYNLAGWVTQVTDPRTSGNVAYFGYDNLGRKVCRYTAACTASTGAADQWIYDAAGNVTQALNPSVAYVMAYDDDGRLATVKRGTTLETTYTYTASTGLLASVADAAGTTSFGYNAAAQIETVNDPFVAGTPVTTYGYDAVTGRMVSRVDAQANLKWLRTYEAQTGRLDTQTIENNTSHSVLASFDLGYDKGSNITSEASSVFSNASNGTTSYTYDRASRLTKATGPNATGASTVWDYAYDGAGNRTIATTTTAGTVTSNETTTFNSQGLPTGSTNPTTGETLTYTHDQVGDLLTQSDGAVGTNDWTYAYDTFGRTTCAKQATSCSGTTAVTFTYDALDRAFSRTYNSASTAFTYSGLSEQLAKVQVGAGTPTTYASTLGGAPLAEMTGSTVSFDLRDPHGDVVGLASTSAANQGTVAYDAYGKPLASSGTQSLFGYQGDMTDPVTKQVDMGTRWYTPGMSRFSSRDSVFGDSRSLMSLNQYAYGLMDPVTMSDPTGMYPTCAVDNGCNSDWEAQDAYNRAVASAGGSNACQCDNYNPIVVPRPAPPIPPTPGQEVFIAHMTFSISQEVGHVATDHDYEEFFDNHSNLFTTRRPAPIKPSMSRGLVSDGESCGRLPVTTVTLLVFQFSWSRDCGGGYHPESLGYGLGVPGVSQTYAVGGDPCIGLDVAAGYGPATVGGSLGIGMDDEGNGTIEANTNAGVSVSPTALNGGAFFTIGEC